MTVVGMYVCGAKQDLPFFMFCPAMTKFLNGCIGMPRCIRLHPNCGAKSSKWPLGPSVSRENPAPPFGTSNSAHGDEPETPWAQEKICRNPSGSIRCTRFLCPTHQEGHIMSIRPLHQEQQAKVLRVFSPAVAHMLVLFQVIYYEVMLYVILSFRVILFEFLLYCIAGSYCIKSCFIALLKYVSSLHHFE